MDADRPRLLTISRFAELTWLTSKMLRHYDSIGLLVPAGQDPDTGYRYYHPGQVEEAERIRLLRDLDVPLTEISAALKDGGGGAAVAAVLRAQRAAMEARRVEAERIIASVRPSRYGVSGRRR